MSYFNDVMDRLKEKLGVEEDKDIIELFDGMSASAFSQRKRKGSVPYEDIINVCRDRGISIDYVIKGKPESFEAELTGGSGSNDKSIWIPYHKDIQSINSDSSQFVTFPKDRYPELSESSTIHAASFSGDSMEGNILDGAMMFINMSDQEIASGKIYVIRSKDETMVKRIFIDPSDETTLLLRSDNIFYPEFKVSPEKIEVIGRVMSVYNRAKLA
ncbi:MAG: LexA family transcriptional regulator [Campylobacterota bacterium]